MTRIKFGGREMFGAMGKTLTLGLLAFGLGLGGCAEPELIDRVQPDLIKKSDLMGKEFYLLDTITRAPYASHYAFTGLQGNLQRGVFEVEESNLLFYRTYEFVEGLEGYGIRDDSDTPLLDADGNVVTETVTLPDGSTTEATRYVYRSNALARYPITGHYDVRRSYNTQTGEPTNVVVEDASEKFWYQRDYMRVDFGRDSAHDQARLGMHEYFSAAIYEGEEGPEGIGLRIEEEGDYIDFVTRGFIQAPQVWYGSWGWIPTCLFYPWYTGSYYECTEEEFHIRTSFMAVDKSNSYMPLKYDDHMLNKFGFYRTARPSFDQYYGNTYSKAIRNVRRFRLYEDYVDNNGDGEPDWESMTPKPVVYYLSKDFPRELLPGSVDLADQWNALFSEVVKEHTGQDVRMFVLCENNDAEVQRVLQEDPNALLAETDPSVCKDMDKSDKLLGDLRYNMLVSVNDPTQYGLYGYGPMHSDPISGEIIHANAFNYTANMRLGARNAVDQIEYAAGVQNFRDITQAQHILTELKAKALKGTQGDPKKLTTIEAAQQIASVTVPMSASQAMVSLQSTDQDMASARMKRLLETDEFDHVWHNAEMAAAVGLPVSDLENYKDEVGLLRELAHPAVTGSDELIHWKRQQDSQLGIQAICMGEHFDNSFRGLAADYKPLYDAHVCEGLANHEDRDQMVFDFEAFSEPGASCDTDSSICGANQVCTHLDQGEASGKYCMTPCSTGALLDQLRQEIRRVNQISEFAYWDPNALYTDTKSAAVTASQIAARKLIEDIREQVFVEVFDRIWSTVAMHEVGHNVGMRHNFASSTDALNYFPRYWDLKGHEVGGEWVPHSVFGETDGQVRQRIREYQQTSIMEYTGAFNARWQGLGGYDRAAILYAYGHMVEVFDNPPNLSDLQQYIDEPADDDPTNYDLGGTYEAPLAKALRKIHHTNYPDTFGGVENITKRNIVHANDVADLSKPCSMFDDPYDPAVCGKNSFCQPFPAGHYCTKPNMVEVPFRFCSDEYNWRSPTCQTHDEGTDMYQMIVNRIEDYEAYWPFYGYKRDNDLFSPSGGYWGYVMYQMQFMRKHFEHWAYDYARYNANDWWEKRFGQPWHLDINGGLNETLAAQEIFTFMANIFGRPSDGYYGWNDLKGRYEPVVNNGKNTYTNVFQVREDTGARPMYPSYDFSGYLYTPSRGGAFYDRLAALQMMTYPMLIFAGGTDRSFNMRRFRLNFATVWPQRMQNILAGLLTSEPQLFGWCIEHDGEPPTTGGSGDPIRVKPRMWFGSEEELDAYYDNCVAMTPEPEYSFPTTQYRLPALASIYGMGWMSYTYDRTFMDRSRIWLKGEGNDITVPEGFETVEYTDPFSGKTYIAPYDPAEFDPYAEVAPREAVPPTNVAFHNHNYWPGARMLAISNDLLDEYTNLSQLSGDYAYSDLQQMVGRLEILRALYAVFEY